MVEVCIFNADDGDEFYRAAWDTEEEARADLLEQLIPLFEMKFRQLQARGVVIDREYYFNKRGRVRKAVKENDTELHELCDILWQGEEAKLQWHLKLIPE